MINSHFFDVYVFNISKNVSVSEFITMNLFFLVVMVKIDGSLTVDFNLSLTKSLKTLIISMLLSFFIVKFVKL